MDAICRVIEIILNALESYIFYKWVSAFIKPKVKQNIIRLGLCIIFAVSTVKSVFYWKYGSNNFSNIFFTGLIIAAFIFIQFGYQGKNHIKFFIFLGHLVLQMISEMSIMLIASIIKQHSDMAEILNNIVYRTYMNFWARILYFYIFTIIYKKRKEIERFSNNYYKFFACMICIQSTISIFLIMMFNHNEGDFSKDITFIMVGTSYLFMVASFIVVVRLMIKTNKAIMEEKLKMQSMEMHFKLSEDITIVTNKLSGLRHDMNNHMMIIHGLVYTNQVSELKKYVSNLIHEVKQANDLIITKNKILSALLNYKMAIAKEKEIDLECNIRYENLDLSEMEICSLFGNLLDNAIEANSNNQKSNRWIELEISESLSEVSIICSNTFIQVPLIINNCLMTTKRAKHLHGIGTKNINDIVANHNGTVEYEIEDEVFYVKIIMKKQKKKEWSVSFNEV